jgi:hypothetical protein
MADKTVTASSGIGFTGMLTILFIALKLTNYVEWSWWWVLSPSWLPLALILGFVAVCFVFAGISKLLVWALER